MIRFGTNPIAWSNDDDRSLGADISLERCLREASAIGFDGIELGHKMPTDPVELKAALAPHGLRLVSGWHSLNLLSRGAEAEQDPEVYDPVRFQSPGLKSLRETAEHAGLTRRPDATARHERRRSARKHMVAGVRD